MYLGRRGETRFASLWEATGLEIVISGEVFWSLYAVYVVGHLIMRLVRDYVLFRTKSSL